MPAEWATACRAGLIRFVNTGINGAVNAEAFHVHYWALLREINLFWLHNCITSPLTPLTIRSAQDMATDRCKTLLSMLGMSPSLSDKLTADVHTWLMCTVFLNFEEPGSEVGLHALKYAEDNFFASLFGVERPSFPAGVPAQAFWLNLIVLIRSQV